jgi:Flp pilus assembly secretin CpaC
MQAKATAETEKSAAVPSRKDKEEAGKLYLEGAKAVNKNNLTAALDDFQKASALDPRNKDYQAAEQVAKSNLVTQLVEESDRAKNLGHLEEAHVKLLKASMLAPDNLSVLQHLTPEAVSTIEDPYEDSATPGVKLAPAPSLEPAAGKHSFHIHGTGQELLQQVLAAYGIIPTIDPSVVAKRTNFDGDDLSFDEAASMLRAATDSFFVPLDPKRVLVAKDTKQNREQFQRELLETLYLPGLSSTELNDMGNLARTLFDAQQASVQAGSNTLTVRAPRAKLVALNHTMADLLDGRSQVDLEVRIIEVDVTKTTNIGISPPQSFGGFNVESELQSVINSNSSLVQEIVSSGLAPAGDLAAIVAVLIASGQVSNPLLSEAFGTFGNGLTLTGVTIPGATANLALNSSDTRMIEDVHLRLQDQAEGDLKVGEKYPIETSSYSGLTSSSVSIPGVSTAGLSSELAALGLGAGTGTQQPIPQVQYQDIGLEVKVTPHILRSNNVSLEFDLKLQALAGSSLNSIPELTNRSFTATSVAKAGETAIFVSDLTKQESNALSGTPGLSELPGFQSATDQDRMTSHDTLLVVITPRIIRREHTEIAGPAILLPRHD